MVDGQFKNMPLIIIQARTNSSRLPNKILKKINDKTLIEILIERLKKSGFNIVVATSKDTTNDKLVVLLNKLNVKVFRGSEDDVLSRFQSIINLFHPNYVIRITADNPLIDGFLVKKIFNSIDKSIPRFYLSSGRSKSYPIGTTFEIISSNLILELADHELNDKEKEHVTPGIYNGRINDVIFNFPKNKETYNNISLTVDTIEDFDIIKLLIEDHNCDQKNLDQIVEIYNNLKINQIRKQKKWYE